MRYAIKKDGKVVRVVSRLPKSGLPSGFSVEPYTPRPKRNWKRFAAISLLLVVATAATVFAFTRGEQIQIVPESTTSYPIEGGVDDGSPSGGDDHVPVP